MKEFLSDYEGLLSIVDSLMVKLRTHMLSKKLRTFTPFKEKCRYELRRSSSFQMLERYQKLLEFLPRLLSEEIYVLLPSSRQNRQIDTLCAQLKDLEFITTEFQKED